MNSLVDKRIFVAGHGGLVGSAICHLLKSKGASRVILRTRQELDLLRQSKVEAFFRKEKPELIFIAAARVGGIEANASFQADFLYENLTIATNLLSAAASSPSTQKLVYLGSSCIYPRLAPQPIAEDSLLTGPLEPTNQGYAIAKIAGLKLCEMYRRQYGKNFVGVMPTNLYGPGDNYHPRYSHVIPGLMRRIHEAKANNAPSVVVWGTGKARRDFLHVDDLASALWTVLERYQDFAPINVGSGTECSIAELVQALVTVIGFKGDIIFDSSMPDGTPRKILDIGKISALGWKPKIELAQGLKATYAEALKSNAFDSVPPAPKNIASPSFRLAANRSFISSVP